MTEQYVSFYTSYGYRQKGHWVIPLRLWVRERPGTLRELAARGVRKVLRRRAGLERLTPEQKRCYLGRVADFVADSKSNQQVAFMFDGDPERRIHSVVGNRGKSKTDLNGTLLGELVLDDDYVKGLLVAQESTQGWLSFTAISDSHRGVGRVRLIEPEGLSVISDIDDTVKLTEIVLGKAAVLRNTFFREFIADPHMIGMYHGFESDVAFHYVSGGPWQLYDPLHDFLFDENTGFPPGSMHMKNVRTHFLHSDAYHDFWDLLFHGSQKATFKQKVTQISQLLNHFPQRKFILIGDSGEQDPEVFRLIASRFSDQIQEIRICDIVDDHRNNPHRLADMCVIKRTVLAGSDP